MKHSRVASLVLVICSCLVSCATDERKAIEAGAIKLSQREMTKVFPGSTTKGEDQRGPFTNYYLIDGRKLRKEEDQATERKWWIDKYGRWCETLFVEDNKEICGATIYKDDRGLTWYSEKGDAIASFSLTTRNLEELEEPDLEFRQATYFAAP